ncbi:MAG: TIGR03621 family F420-dependent LLM class oxidoreductase, partial [Acidimicrobiia bacterium]|nr:TIGR03621 family F420-dependent LLM class oxidoreductase [Acidimicrobiia bacterium]
GHDHKFRFGVQVSSASSGADWRDKARRIEDLGYSTLTMPDHFVDTAFAPMAAIAFAAAHTTTLRIGHLVLGNDYKHPAVTAKEAATIDLLSDGRLEFGIGAGWMQTDYDALGMAYDSAGTRVDRLEEALAVIKGAWSGEKFNFSGKHYTITDYTGLPTPVQKPHPPILVGGGAPRVLRLAGREADIVGINPNLRKGAITDDAIKGALAEGTRQKVEWVKEGAGKRFKDIELQIRYFLASITDDAEGFASALAGGFGLSAQEALDSGVALVGTVEQCIERLQKRREEWGVTYIVLGDDTFEAFAPVVAALAGT